MWQHLTVLAVVPLLATAVLGVTAVKPMRTAVERIDGAQQQLLASVQLDAVRRAVDSELLPTVITSVIGNADATARAGFDDIAALQRTVPVRTVEARAATDAAMAAVDAAPARTAITSARLQLRTARAAADQGAVSTATLADTYLRLSDSLFLVERSASVKAGALVATERSAAAINDVSLVTDLTGLGSRQLPVLLAAVVLEGEQREQLAADWRITTGSWLRLAETPGALSSSRMRSSWHEVAVSSPGAVAVAALSSPLALAESSPGGLTANDVLALAPASADRDAALSELLQHAVTAAMQATAQDRSTSETSLKATVAFCCLVMVLSALAMVVQARSLTRSLRALALAATSARDGQPVAPLRRGPREVREVGHALATTAAGLRRVREQVEAVARGDLRAASEGEAVPGRLGEVVHRSVQEMVRAVQARDALQAELADRAAHDALTRLPNRATTLAGLSAALERARRSGAVVAVLFIDLDGFKLVNDSCGHAAGDEVLRVVSARMLAHVRSGDLVGRLGGDEFVVVAEDADESAVVELGHRLITAVSEPVDVEAGGGVRAVAVGASIGLAVARAGDLDADALLAEADTATYRAKARGKGRVEVFGADLRREALERDDLQRELRVALECGDLSLEHQPVVDTRDGSVMGWEASAVWDHPGHGRLTHDALITASEAAGLGRQLGRWVLQQACAQLAAWRTDRAAGCAPGVRRPVAVVNLTRHHAADERVVDDVADALVSSGLEPHHLVLEVPEAAVHVDSAALWNLSALRALGVHVCLDGVGTGTTSLQQLSRLPVDTLKIDPAVAASDDPAQVRLVGLLVQAATAVGLLVASEGVVDAAQLSRLVSLGCVAVQGPLLAPAASARDAEELDLAALAALVLAAADHRVSAPLGPQGVR